MQSDPFEQGTGGSLQYRMYFSRIAIIKEGQIKNLLTHFDVSGALQRPGQESSVRSSAFLL